MAAQAAQPATRIVTAIRCVQPGERGLFRLERAFGRWRRWWLRRFRRGYVQRMAALRTGECADCAHDIVDPRDLKLLRNVCGYDFPAAADPFRWRDRLPFARQGLVEVTLVGLGGLLAASILMWLEPWLAVPPAVLAGFYAWFFRDPERAVPTEADLVVAPCDGLVDEICAVDHCEPLGGPALRIGISLSLFDVHLNRCPIAGTVTATHYAAGVFRNAQRRGDHSANEQFWTVFQPAAPEGGGRTTDPIAVRQIAGPMARTIVNEVRLGEVVARGTRFGMIKFGSRTELYVPRSAAGYRVVATLGQRVLGGVTAVLDARTGVAAAPPTPDTVSDTVADTVSGTVTDTVSGTVTDTVSGTVTDTVPGTVTDTVPGTVADSVSDTVASRPD
jgi:phosphatidylserine decarboxylase